MPTIIPKTYYCPKCKKEINKKHCDCGSKTKPVAPYTVRFRWINQDGMEEHKRLTGTPPWMTQSAAQKGYEKWVFEHPTNKMIDAETTDFMPLYNKYKSHLAAQVKESSYVATLHRLEKFVVPYFGNKKINEIKPLDIIEWQNNLTNQGYSTKYKNAIRASLTGFYSYLLMYGFTSPFIGTKSFKNNKQGKKQIDFWTEKEFENFISTVEDPLYHTLFAFLYLTGCRKGEALALTWNDVDLKTNKVKIHATLTRTTDTGRSVSEGKKLSDYYRVTSPKTENSYRTIPLPQNLTEFLKKIKPLDATPTDFIFGKGGNFIPFKTLENTFKKYIRVSNVKQIRIHDLRHSHASLLINKGDNQISTLYVIAERLGDTVQMVLETYGHLFPNEQEHLMEKLNLNI